MLSVAAHGTLPDGTPWPVPVTLDVPAERIKPDAGRLLLQDPEGTPLAVLDITELAALDRADRLPLDRAAVGGRPTAARTPRARGWSGSAAR